MTSPSWEPTNSADSPLNDSLPDTFETDTTMQELPREKSQAIEETGPRHERELDKHGLRPVWTAWDGYPGEVPEDIQNWLDDSGRRGEYIWVFRRVELLTKLY